MRMKKMLAAILSATMVMSMSMTAFASGSDPTTGGSSEPPKVEADAPIYAYDVVQVIVPTEFKVAFNPGKLEVTTGSGASDKSSDQIVSKNYGIVNKSTRNKVVSVSLKVEDANTDSDGNGKINFVDTAAKATTPDDVEDYAVYLTVIPAKDGTIQANSKAVDKDTAAADLGNVTMTEAAADDAITLNAGDNEIAFVLDQATYALKSGSKLDLDNQTANNVSSLYEVSALGTNGATAFTFGGAMNDKAKWEALTGGIKITAVYTNETAPDYDASGKDANRPRSKYVAANTGAVYSNPTPGFSTGNEVGTIKYNKGTGNDAIDTITKIEMVSAGGRTYDVLHSLSNAWGEATKTDNMIKFDAKVVASFATKDIWQATVTYTTTGGDTKTATVDVKMK